MWQVLDPMLTLDFIESISTTFSSLQNINQDGWKRGYTRLADKRLIFWGDCHVIMHIGSPGNGQVNVPWRGHTPHANKVKVILLWGLESVFYHAFIFARSDLLRRAHT